MTGSSTTTLVALLALLVAGCDGGDDTSEDSGLTDDSGEEDSGSTDSDTDTEDTSNTTALAIGEISAQETPVGVELEFTVTLSGSGADTATIEVSSSSLEAIDEANVSITDSGTIRTVTVTATGVGGATLSLSAYDTAGGTSASGDVFIDTYPNHTGWTGIKQWIELDITGGDGLDVNKDGEVFACGHQRAGTGVGFEAWLRKYNTDGSEAWTTLHWPDADSQCKHVKALDDGTSVMANTAKVTPESNTQTLWLGKYKADGTFSAELGNFDHFDGVGIYTSAIDFDMLQDGTFALLEAGSFNTGPSTTAATSGLRRSGSTGPALEVELYLDAQGLGGGFVAMDTDITYGALNAKGTLWNAASTGGHDGVVFKVDANGDVEWTKRLTGTGDQQVNGGVVNDDGDLIVCGGSETALGSSYTNAGLQDSFVRKLDFDGNTVWTAEFGTTKVDTCYDIALGRDGTIYTTGVQARATDGSTGYGYVAAHSPDGVELWRTLLTTDTPADTVPLSLAHSGRSVFVTGRTFGKLTGTGSAGNKRHAFVARLSEDGTIQ